MTTGRGLWKELQRTTTGRGLWAERPGATCELSLGGTWSRGHYSSGLGFMIAIPLRRLAHTKQPARSRPWPTRPQPRAGSRK
jgi:hypothetical protein